MDYNIFLKMLNSLPGDKVINVDTLELRRAIYRKLHFSVDFRGRGLIGDVENTPLRRGDRLEPSKTLCDVAAFEFKPVPFITHFWRMVDDDRLVHASPLWDIDGLLYEMWCIDLLHSWHLGPLPSWIGTTFRFLLGTRVLAPDIPWLHAKECDRLGLLSLRSQLWIHYRARRASDINFKTKGSEVHE